MAIDKTRIVDGIGIDRSTGVIHLTISDHLEWSADHIATLQEKINAYLAFLESGEVITVYPNAKGRMFSIDVVSLYRPNAAGLSFLAGARSVIEDAGFEFTFGPSHNGYADDAA